MAVSKAPKGLSAAAKRWWTLMKTDYGIEDTGGIAVLTLAAQALDRAEAARMAIDNDGMFMTDRWGAKRPHPAVAVERDARAAMLSAIKSLRLDLEPLRGPGRPPGAF
jgi:hypothetical protein